MRIVSVHYLGNKAVKIANAAAQQGTPGAGWIPAVGSPNPKDTPFLQRQANPSQGDLGEGAQKRS